MSNPITPVQERYLSALLKNVGETRFDELKQQLRIAKKTPMAELTKDEAYQMITKVIAESTAEQVKQALDVALEKEDTDAEKL